MDSIPDLPDLSNSASFIHHPPHYTAADEGSYGDVDSLPSSEPDSDTVSYTTEDEDDEESDAEREWKESMQQLEMLLTMVIVPWIGKYYGRRFAYWGWARFMEWKYPVEITFNNKGLFKGAGVVEAAASL